MQWVECTQNSESESSHLNSLGVFCEGSKTYRKSQFSLSATRWGCCRGDGKLYSFTTGPFPPSQFVHP